MLREKCHDCSVETHGKSRDSWDNDISFPFLDQGTGRLDECFYKVQKIAFFSSAEYWCWKSVGLLAFGFFSHRIYCSFPWEVYQWQNNLGKFWGNRTGIFFFFNNYYACDHFKVHFSLFFFYSHPKVCHWSHCVRLVFTTWYTFLNIKDNVIILQRVFVLPAKHNISTFKKEV